MSRKLTPADIGKPNLKVAGFQLWVHGRQFPHAEDYYDGNWLRVTAYCGALGASVRAEGAILMVTDIAGFGDQCPTMLSGKSKTATLDPLEPELKMALEAADGLGHIQAQVEIIPDHLSQAHRFEFEVDQSYLPSIIRQCTKIVQEYPIRGQKDQNCV